MKNKVNISIDMVISKSNLSDAMERIGKELEQQAKINCPVRTGNLQQSIEHSSDGNSAVVGTSCKYAPFVEYGTGKFAEKDPEDGWWVYIDGEYPHPPKLTNNKYTKARAAQIVDWLINDQKVPERFVHMTQGQHPNPFLRKTLDQVDIRKILVEELFK